MVSPYTTTIVDTLFQISNHLQSLEKKFNALGTINSYLSPLKHLFVFSRVSLDWIVNVIFQHCKVGGDNSVD